MSKIYTRRGGRLVGSSENLPAKENVEEKASNALLRGSKKRAAFGDISNANVVTEDASQKTKDIDMKEAASERSLTWIDRIAPQDRADVADPSCVAEYVGTIFAHMRATECKYSPPADYMSSVQSDINERMRGVLIDWLVEVHWKFKLYPETLFLCVSLLDRFLSRKPNVPRHQLQLVGVTCLLIASKYEDIYAPEIKDIVHICDKTYRREEILSMEVCILNTLQFEITHPSPHLFLIRMGRMMRADEKHFFLAQYMLELALPDYKTWLKHPASLMAAASLYLANKLLRKSPAWPSLVAAEVPGSNEQQVKNVAKEICIILQSVDDAQLKAVKKKFSQPKYLQVAKLVLS